MVFSDLLLKVGGMSSSMGDLRNRTKDTMATTQQNIRSKSTSTQQHIKSKITSALHGQQVKEYVYTVQIEQQSVGVVGRLYR